MGNFSVPVEIQVNGEGCLVELGLWAGGGSDAVPRVGVEPTLNGF